METLRWDQLERHIHQRVPFILSIGGTRGARIGGDGEGGLFARLPMSAGVVVPPSPYSELAVATRVDETGVVLEVSTATENLHKEFHRFAGLLAEEFEAPSQDACTALQLTLARWVELASTRSVLSEERQLGLLGELHLLSALIKVEGPKIVSSWTAQNSQSAERHDFRMGNVDVEVKATRSTRREHIIHGLGQLEPSLGHSLYVLSLRFESAGAGKGSGLAQKANEIRSAVKGTEVHAMFESKLAASGYDDSDSIFYLRELKFADLPVLVAVDAACPHIVRETISGSLGSQLAARIRDVSYRVDFEGLGNPQGTLAYTSVLGKTHLD